MMVVNKMLEISKEIKFVMDRIEAHQYEVYIIGGFVRDSLLGLQPKDCDLATSALPEMITSIFSDQKCLLIGLKHGTVTVIIDDTPIEITTYRKESDYKDHRHPQNVDFNTDLKSDIARRDFTINGLAYHPEKGIIDYFGGLRDLQEGIIRCINDPNERFTEDALRIIRALRFSSVYDFKIELETSQAIHRNKALLEYVSQERMTHEFTLLLMGKGYERVISNYQDIFKFISVGFDSLFVERLDRGSVAKLANSNDLVIRLAMFLDLVLKHNEPIKIIEAKKILAKMRFPRKTIKNVLNLIEYQKVEINNKMDIKLLMSKMGNDNLDKLILMKYNNETIDLIQYKKLCQLKQAIIDNKETYQLNQLNVDGKDILDLPNIKVAQINLILNSLLEMVIKEEIENKKAVLLSTAQTMIDN